MSAPITGDQGRKPKKAGKRRVYSDVLQSADTAYYRGQPNPRRRSGVDGYGRPGGPSRAQATNVAAPRREFSDILRSADAAYYADKSQTRLGRKQASRDAAHVRAANAAAGPEILTRQDAVKTLRGLVATLTETDRPVSVTVGKGLRLAARSAMDQLIADGSLDAEAAARVVFVDAAAPAAKAGKAAKPGKIKPVKVVPTTRTVAKSSTLKAPAPDSFLDVPSPEGVLAAPRNLRDWIGEEDAAGTNRGGDGFDGEAPDSFLDGHGPVVDPGVSDLLDAPADTASEPAPADVPDDTLLAPTDASDELDPAADFLNEPARSLEEDQPMVDAGDDLTAAATEESAAEVPAPVETPAESPQPRQGGRNRRRR